jgi:hypothetical protein
MVTQGRNWESREKNQSLYMTISQLFYHCNKLYIRKVGLEFYIYVYDFIGSLDFSKQFQLKIFWDENLEGELWAKIPNF